MALKLIASYSKRLGLPGFSSHQFSVCVETEVNTTDDIAQEAERLYNKLQSNIDEQIQQTGFVPPIDYGMASADSQAPTPGKVVSIDRWKCSIPQRNLILSHCCGVGISIPKTMVRLMMYPNNFGTMALRNYSTPSGERPLLPQEAFAKESLDGTTITLAKQK